VDERKPLRGGDAAHRHSACLRVPEAAPPQNRAARLPLHRAPRGEAVQVETRVCKYRPRHPSPWVSDTTTVYDTLWSYHVLLYRERLASALEMTI
jgi:hypothetical protein